MRGTSVRKALGSHIVTARASVNRRRRSTPSLLFLDEEADPGAQTTMMDCGR
jgi:hypothetical protein